MNRHLAIVAAAALAIGGVSVSWAQDRDIGDRTKDAAQDIREKTAETLGIGSADQASQHKSEHAEAIHDVMAQVAEAAMTKDGLDDIAERLVDADRNRLGQNDEALKSDDALNDSIARLNDAWKAKFGDEFNIKDEDKVYSLQFATITEGELGDTARTAGETVTGEAARTDDGAAVSGRVGDVTGDAKVDTDTGTARVDVDRDRRLDNTGVDAPRADTDGQTAADRNLNDPGRNIATLRIAESHGLPAVNAKMIHEAGGWKFDIPDSVDAMKFKSNVSQALMDISNKQNEWPADQDEAYRHVTHRVLMALYDVQPGAGAGAGAGVGTGENTSGTENR